MKRIQFKVDCLLLSFLLSAAALEMLTYWFLGEIRFAIAGAVRGMIARVSSAIRSVLDFPSAMGQAWMNLPWNHLLSVRRGFLLGALAGFSIVGSLLWAIPVVTTYMPRQFGEPLVATPTFMPSLHGSVPTEMAWFFIQFPYVSETAQIRSKNHHTFIVTDSSRKRNYVVNFGQRYRRVEIYSPENNQTQTQVFTPGSKREWSLISRNAGGQPVDGSRR